MTVEGAPSPDTGGQSGEPPPTAVPGTGGSRQSGV